MEEALIGLSSNSKLLLTGIFIPCLMALLNYVARRLADLGTSFGSDILVLLLTFDACALAYSDLIPKLAIGDFQRNEILIVYLLVTFIFWLILIGHFEKGYYQLEEKQIKKEKSASTVSNWIVNKYYSTGSWLFVIMLMYLHILTIGWVNS